MADITPPKNEETALQAGRREVQEGVKVKFPNDCDLVHYFTVSPPIFNVWIAWKACPLHDCVSEYPKPTILLGLAVRRAALA